MLVRRVELIVAVFWALFLSAGDGSTQESGRKCWIKSIVGDVKIQRNKSPKWIEARPNMPVKENDAVRTFVESEAVIQTSEGSVITLKENTTLELSAFSEAAGGATSTGVRMLNGDLVANVKKLMGQKSKFEFETPTAVAAIRGTKLGINVDNEKTDIKVYEGKVFVKPKGGSRETELKENEMTSIKKGQKDVIVEDLKKKDEETRGVHEEDTTKEEIRDTVREEDTTASADTVKTPEVAIELKISSPENGQVIKPGAQIVVMGKVSPAGAAVKVQGIGVSVSSSGDFKYVIARGPLDEGQHSIDIEASYKDDSKTATRYVVVKAVQAELKLVINEPVNGLVITKPLIRVSGIVTPGAEVVISGMSVPVASNGTFSKDIPIPDEEGQIAVEIEATYNQQTKSETRTVTYKAPEEEIVILVQLPVDNQVVCDKRLAVKGMVRPVSMTEITINGATVPVRSGLFSDFVIIADDQGDQEIEFEVTKDARSKTVKKIVKFDPGGQFCNKDVPTIQPGYLPPFSKIQRLAFIVYDKTLQDEITLFTETDGMKEQFTGAPGTSFYLELEEGVHTYTVYAKDLAGNLSAKVGGIVKYLVREPMIRLQNPSGAYHLLHIPPSNPGGTFRPEFTVEFTVENLPDDNPKLLKEIRVVNKTSGDSESMKNFTTYIDFDFDIELKLKTRNMITIEVRDVNDRIMTKDIVIEVR